MSSEHSGPNLNRVRVEFFESLEKGTWCEFIEPDASVRKVKLAWVSPLKSLYIFTTVHREEAFSLAAETLIQRFRDEQVRIVEVGSFVTEALVEVLEEAEATA